MVQDGRVQAELLPYTSLFEFIFATSLSLTKVKENLSDKIKEKWK